MKHFESAEQRGNEHKKRKKIKRTIEATKGGKEKAKPKQKINNNMNEAIPEYQVSYNTSATDARWMTEREKNFAQKKKEKSAKKHTKKKKNSLLFRSQDTSSPLTDNFFLFFTLFLQELRLWEDRKLTCSGGPTRVRHMPLYGEVARG